MKNQDMIKNDRDSQINRKNMEIWEKNNNLQKSEL